MDLSLLLWLVISLLLFWGVGLYNRLMRLRSRGFEVLAVVEKNAGTCVALVRQYAAASPEEEAFPVYEHWNQMCAAAGHLEQVLASSPALSLEPSAVLTLANAWAAMHSAWLEAIATPMDLAGPAIPPDMQEAWAVASNRVQSASGGFNQIITRYNESIRQYPARWVAAYMGFRPAGYL